MEKTNNKVIVITGASSGIGAATARKLSRLRGVILVLGATREDQLRSLSAQLGDNILFVKTDVSSKPDVDHLIARAIDRFGRIDVLWNNAGVMPLSFFDES